MCGIKIFNKIQNNFDKLVLIRQRHFWKNMVSIDLNPPHSVRGMTNLDKDAFKKTIIVPQLKVSEGNFNKILPLLKKFILKMEHLKPVVRPLDLTDDESAAADKINAQKLVLLHPLAVKNWNCLPTKELEQFNINANNFLYDTIELGYENWRADELLKFILPENQESLTSYSRIGHIVHINLRDHLQPYKQIIGDILKDKIVGCRTVVNKLSNISNTYRNFQLELICGDPDYKVEVKENGIVFEFDFSKVYWNPRLSTEHERIVRLLKPTDILYDVFAGVGPFSVPASKKKCKVLANDLNPESYNWLNQNIKRNKCSANNIRTFNKDGREFILNDLHDDLLNVWQNTTTTVENTMNIHITMNLPAMAVEFLDAFKGLFKNEKISVENIKAFPLVHVYCFAKGENNKEIAKELVETNLNAKLTDNLVGCYFVRNVAPNKDMYRISFYLTGEILFSNETGRKRSRSTNSEDINCNSKKMSC